MVAASKTNNQSNRSVTASANKNKEEGMEKENKIIKGGSNLLKYEKRNEQLAS